MPKRIQRRRARGWQLPPGAVCVDRSSKWGNPFVIGEHGTRAECVDLFAKMCRGLICISCSRELVDAQRAYRDRIGREIAELRGKDLACWCPPGAPCHADLLIEIANRAEVSP